MPSFWALLQAKIRAGEMEYDEALRRDNYYSFVKEMPGGVLDSKRYVLETPFDELPPYTASIGDIHAKEFAYYIEMVRLGKMCAYDAAQAYFDAVSG